MKRCIVHIPYELDPSAARARMVRPRKMIRAFRNIGYEVYEISGYAAERKARIAEAKRQIEAGVQYDFAYSEVGTVPMLLTEPRHYPTHPFLDFGFFRFLKKHGIPIGLFYPDIYWKFDNYGEDYPAWKRYFALKNFELDLREYEKYLTRFYVPDRKICEYLQSEKLIEIAEELPPGADNLTVYPKSYEKRDFSKEPLTIFYVGGLGNHYQSGELLSAVSQTPNTKLILCCREPEWEKEKSALEPFMNEHIEVIHKSGAELEPYYEQADLCSLLFKQSTYMEMAKPVKAYEYLAHEIPVLATRGTGMGDFAEETGIGWAVDYSAEAISKTIRTILNDPQLLNRKRQFCQSVKKENTWEKRALQAAEGMVSGMELSKIHSSRKHT